VSAVDQLSDVGEPLAEAATSELAQILFSDGGRDDALAAIAQVAHKLLPTCIAASVTVAERGQMRTAVSSAELADILDEAQYDTREGPCLDAIRSRSMIPVHEFAEESRWPGFVERVRQTPVQSSLSHPLIVGDEAIGALNLYSDAPSGLLTSVESSSAFARSAAVPLANAMAFHRAAELSSHLSVALEHRDVIGQAKGLLMASEGVTADEAFDLLRERSQRSNRKLYDLAKEMTAAPERDSSA
jgi:GAF domain-containing protein